MSAGLGILGVLAIIAFIALIIATIMFGIIQPISDTVSNYDNDTLGGMDVVWMFVWVILSLVLLRILIAGLLFAGLGTILGFASD